MRPGPGFFLAPPPSWHHRYVPLDWKLVSVKLSAFALVLPTFNLGFCSHIRAGGSLETCRRRTWKSFFFSFFFLTLEPIMTLFETKLVYNRSCMLKRAEYSQRIHHYEILTYLALGENSSMRLRREPNWVKAVRSREGCRQTAGNCLALGGS